MATASTTSESVARTIFPEDLQQIDWPIQWSDAQAVQLVRVLAALGCEGDAAFARQHLKNDLTDKHRSMLDQDAIADIRKEMLAKSALDAFPYIRSIAILGTHLGVPFPQPSFERALSEFQNADVLVAWVGCFWHGRLDQKREAVDAYRSVPFPGRVPAQVVGNYCSAMMALGELEQRDAFLLSYVDRFGSEHVAAPLALQCARLYRRAERFDDALMLLDRLQSQPFGEPPVPATPAIRQAAANEQAELIRIHKGPVSALEFVKKQLADSPDNLGLLIRYVRLLVRANQSQDAAAVMIDALKKHPTSGELLGCLMRVPFPNDAVSQVLETYLGFVDCGALPDVTVRQVLTLMLVSGYRQGMERQIETWAQSQPLAKMMQSGRLCASKRSFVLLNEAFSIAEASPGAPVVMVFPGLRNLVQGIPPKILDTEFAKRRVTAIYAHQDPSLLFLNGAEGIASDLAGVAAYLADLSQVRTARSVAILGASGGGLTALRIGLAIGADACLNYSGLTIIGRPAPNCPDARTERFAAAFSSLSKDELDVRAHWPDDQHMRTELVFGADVTSDRAHAERLADRKGVRLSPDIATQDHNSFLHAYETGAFGLALDRLFDDQTETQT